jgi:uncharacterized membrane protein
MKKAEFLARLRQKLFILPQRELEDTLEYYSEMIDDYVENGCTPEEAVAKMGGVENVAAQVLAGTQTSASQTDGAKKEKKNGNMLLLLILGFPLWFPLLIAAFCILLSVAVVIATLAMVVPWSLVVSFGASALGLLIAGTAILVSESVAAAVFLFGAAMVLGALCIFALWASIHLSVLGAKAIGAMFKGVGKLIFGRR